MSDVRRIDPAVADLIRRYAWGIATDAEKDQLGNAGIFLPIERGKSTGRASCRACGGKIAKDVEAIRFRLDFTFAEHRVVGRSADAYVHEQPCTTTKEGPA